MIARVALSRPSTGSSYSLPDDYVKVTSRRLAVAASIAAGIHCVYIVLYRTVWAASAHALGLGMGVAGLSVSLAVAGYLLSGERAASRVAAVAVAYEIVLALVLAISEAWTLQYTEPSQQVSWGAVVIVLFPFLIPAAPRIVLAASLASAAMTPIAVTLMLELTGQAWPETSVTLSLLLPPFLCAILAWAPTSAIQRLGAAVQHARQLGSYELSELLGTGGMGEVWLARHRLLARPAAVKLIKPERLGANDRASRERILSRFEKEAQVTANLDSPHTVELYDFGAAANGDLFYVMELLDGVDAQTLVERFGPLPSERVVYLLVQACDSLEDAHGRGLVHRDIKPANLFVARKGREFDFLKVLDFGLVKRWRSEASSSIAASVADLTGLGQTAEGQIVGTPAFLAPEAAVGPGAVDHRADLYALGCVGYWLLTGCTVFDEETVMGMAIAHVTKLPEAPSSRIAAPISSELEQLLLQCLAKDREERPQTAGELRQRLSKIPFRAPWSREKASQWWQVHRADALVRPPSQAVL